MTRMMNARYGQQVNHTQAGKAVRGPRDEMSRLLSARYNISNDVSNRKRSE